MCIFTCVLQVKDEFIAFCMNWAEKLQALWENKKDIIEFQSRLRWQNFDTVQVCKNEKNGSLFLKYEFYLGNKLTSM